MNKDVSLAIKLGLPPAIWLISFYIVPHRFDSNISHLLVAPVVPILLFEAFRSHIAIWIGGVEMLFLMYLCHRYRISTKRMVSNIALCTIVTFLAFLPTIYAKHSEIAYVYTLICCTSFCLFLIPFLLLCRRFFADFTERD